MAIREYPDSFATSPEKVGFTQCHRVRMGASGPFGRVINVLRPCCQGGQGGENFVPRGRRCEIFSRDISLAINVLHAEQMSTKMVIQEEAARSAARAGLRYLSAMPDGIRRRRAGKGWVFISPAGHRITDPKEILRIQRLAIPPNWTNVWISPFQDSHLQAVGYDARRRRQYRYHPSFREARDETKFHRTVAFARALPGLRAKIEMDLKGPGHSREKVLATIIRTMDLTSIRVGNREYAKSNQSFGLTTLTSDHVECTGSCVRLQFRGKSGVSQCVELCDRQVARVVKRCQELPGQDLFQYVDEHGEARAVRSEDVNEYLQQAMGGPFTAKDFRTWNGTCAFYEAYIERQTDEACSLGEVVKCVAGILGNRAATCRKYYIHPALMDLFGNAAIRELSKRRAKTVTGLSVIERAVLRFIEDHQRRETRRRGSR